MSAKPQPSAADVLREFRAQIADWRESAAFARRALIEGGGPADDGKAIAYDECANDLERSVIALALESLAEREAGLAARRVYDAREDADTCALCGGIGEVLIHGTLRGTACTACDGIGKATREEQEPSR